MDIATLQLHLQQPQLAPVEQWQSAFCGDMPILIAADGQWYYQNSLIQRPALVQLFASVLIRQQQDYFLQTPQEKVRIQVEDAAFVVTDYSWHSTPSGPMLQLSTNVQQHIPVSARYPLLLQQDPQQQLLPYLQLWRGLSAKLSRNVYYQLAEQATAVYCNQQTHYQIKSAGIPFTLAID